jgi:Holliday junction resolvasome RuvABC DNA-binding subunit
MAEKIILELKDKDFIKYSETEKNTSKNSKISPLTKSQIIETLTAM